MIYLPVKEIGCFCVFIFYKIFTGLYGVSQTCCITYFEVDFFLSFCLSFHVWSLTSITSKGDHPDHNTFVSFFRGGNLDFFKSNSFREGNRVLCQQTLFCYGGLKQTTISDWSVLWELLSECNLTDCESALSLSVSIECCLWAYTKSAIYLNVTSVLSLLVYPCWMFPYSAIFWM